MKAYVMAGGRATRFEKPVEKALLEVGGRTLFARAIDALRTDGIVDVILAVSQHTPDTKREAERLGIASVNTPGLGYHEDVLQLLTTSHPFLTVNVDVPFVNRNHVKTLLSKFEGESLAAVAPASESLSDPRHESVGRDDDGREFVWIGLNIVTPNPFTRTVWFDDPLLTVNINDSDDLTRADRIARERGL